MATNKQGKMAGYINYRMRVTLNDGRQMTGQMLAFDKVRGPSEPARTVDTLLMMPSQHMNVVLADTEEFRRIKKQNKPAAPGAAPGAAQAVVQEEKRTLGLTIVRGAHIVSLSVESPPPADPSTRLGKSTTGGISSTLQVLLPVLAEVCRHLPSVVSPAHPLDSLDVEVVSTALIRPP
ncbi:Small nuclear ribonucleoprotein-associated protein B [Diaporthe eres]